MVKSWVGNGVRERQLGRGSPHPILALKFNENSASCCLFQNKKESVHRPLAIAQFDKVYTLHFGIFSWTDSTTCIPKVNMSYTPAKFIKKSCRSYSINMMTRQVTESLGYLIKPHAPCQIFIEVRIWSVDITVERKLFILPLAITSLDTSIIGAKRVESRP